MYIKGNRKNPQKMWVKNGMINLCKKSINFLFLFFLERGGNRSFYFYFEEKEEDIITVKGKRKHKKKL